MSLLVLGRASLEEEDLGMAAAIARAVASERESELTDAIIQRLDNEISH